MDFSLQLRLETASFISENLGWEYLRLVGLEDYYKGYSRPTAVKFLKGLAHAFLLVGTSSPGL